MKWNIRTERASTQRLLLAVSLLVVGITAICLYFLPDEEPRTEGIFGAETKVDSPKAALIDSEVENGPKNPVTNQDGAEFSVDKTNQILADIEKVAEIAAALEKATESQREKPKEIAELQRRQTARLTQALEIPDPRWKPIQEKDPEAYERLGLTGPILLTPISMLEGLKDSSDPVLVKAIHDYIVSGDCAKRFEESVAYLSKLTSHEFPEFPVFEKSDTVEAVAIRLSEYSQQFEEFHKTQLDEFTMNAEMQAIYVAKAKALALTGVVARYGGRWDRKPFELGEQFERAAERVQRQLALLPRDNDQRQHLAGKLSLALSGKFSR